MYEEIEEYFFSKVSPDISFVYTTFPEIKKDMINDIQQSYLWSDQVNGKEDKSLITPKKKYEEIEEEIDNLDDLDDPFEE